MGCSDTIAEMLERTDPKFRERNRVNSEIDAALRFNSKRCCEMGCEAFAGRSIPHIEPLRPVFPVGNQYLDGDAELAREWGKESGQSYVSAHERAMQAADAVDWLNALAEGGDGRTGFQWLIEHWGMDLRMLQHANDRHLRESASLKVRGLTASRKYLKRQERLAADVPEAELVQRRIDWAKEKLTCTS